MKGIIGVILCLLSFILGIGIGLWLFIGGIIQIISSITPILIPMELAWGIAKVVFAKVIGATTFFISYVIGRGLLE